MRLTRFEQQEIVRLAHARFGQGCSVTLFGSRVDDTAKGGDIDLMLNCPHFVEHRLREESAYVVDLWRSIGEQRIDVILKTPQTPPQKIHDIAHALGVEL